MNKKFANRTNFFLFILVVVGFVGVLNYLLSRYFVRADLTENKTYTISKSTKRILRGLDDVVSFKVFISESNLPPLALNLTNTIKDLLSEYQAYSRGNITVEYLDPTDNNDIKNEARGLGLQEVPMQVIEKDKQQNVMCFMGLAILYGDKKEIMPVLNNVNNLEYDLTSRVLKVTRTEVKKVGFYFGNGPHDFTPEEMGQPPQGGQPRTYNTIKKFLQEQFEVVDVKDLNKGKEVPTDLVTLVVAGPKSLDDREKFEIDQFLMKGGRVVALIDAVEVQTNFGLTANKLAHNTGDILSHYGAKVSQNLLLDASHANISYQVNMGGFVMPVAAPYPLWVRVIRQGFDRNNPAVSGLESMTFMWASSVEPTLDKSDTTRHVTITPIIRTTPYGKEQANTFDLNPRQNWGDFRSGGKTFDLAQVLDGEFKSFFAGKPVPAVKDTSDTAAVHRAAESDKTRAIVEKSPATTLVVMGDSDFLVDGSPNENLVFMNNLVEWLTLGDNLISIRSKSIADRLLDPKLSSGTKDTLRYFNTIAMPLLVALFGMFMFMRRKNMVKKGANA